VGTLRIRQQGDVDGVATALAVGRAHPLLGGGALDPRDGLLVSRTPARLLREVADDPGDPGELLLGVGEALVDVVLAVRAVCFLVAVEELERIEAIDRRLQPLEGLREALEAPVDGLDPL